MKLVFASNNHNKIVEIRHQLPDDIELLSLEDIGCNEDIPETADTIEGNAILKADYVTQNYGYDCFADDTGLEVSALNGAPGVYSARYAGPQKSAENNMQKLLQALDGTTDRSARFKTVIALNLKGEQHLFKGIVNGTIAKEKAGTAGFGYDPIFVPEDLPYTFAQLSLEDKAALSHRGRAVKQLLEFLKS
jgi:XTP/dITP diphosphohydrolase